MNIDSERDRTVDDGIVKDVVGDERFEVEDIGA